MRNNSLWPKIFGKNKEKFKEVSPDETKIFEINWETYCKDEFENLREKTTNLLKKIDDYIPPIHFSIGSSYENGETYYAGGNEEYLGAEFFSKQKSMLYYLKNEKKNLLNFLVVEKFIRCLSSSKEVEPTKSSTYSIQIEENFYKRMKEDILIDIDLIDEIKKIVGEKNLDIKEKEIKKNKMYEDCLVNWDYYKDELCRR